MEWKDICGMVFEEFRERFSIFSHNRFNLIQKSFRPELELPTNSEPTELQVSLTVNHFNLIFPHASQAKTFFPTFPFKSY